MLIFFHLLKKESNTTFNKYLEQINTFISEVALSIVKRLGMILYRFCMIFSTIKKCETKDYNKEVCCLEIILKLH